MGDQTTANGDYPVITSSETAPVTAEAVSGNYLLFSLLLSRDGGI
jgi:hypothetical protein